MDGHREPSITIVTLKSWPSVNSAGLDGVEFSKFGGDVEFINDDLMQKGECYVDIVSQNINVWYVSRQDGNKCFFLNNIGGVTHIIEIDLSFIRTDKAQSEDKFTEEIASCKIFNLSGER